MPIQAPQWTEFLCCPVCCNEFAATQRAPISLGCGHTVCRACLANLHRKQCPFDQTTITTDINTLPVNTALLQLVNCPTLLDHDNSEIISCLEPDDQKCYQQATKCIEELALYLKPFANGSSSILSRPMQRKLVTLVNCQLMEDEGRSRSLRAARSLGERTVTELILQHQNPQQLSANLWAGVRARGCQFLGPAMQEEVLKLVLLALEDGSALSRKVLVMFVVQRLEPHFPQASKTSIGHVVQLLYRASCFKVSKREGDSSLMQLKEEFRTYEALRREHDAQIVQIATEAGLRIAPDQWSALLYGDTAHKSHMQSIIDKLQTPQSFAQSVQELVIALQRTGDPANLSVLRPHLELLASIDPSTESSVPSWQDCSLSLVAVSKVVIGLVDFVMHHGSRKQLDAHNGHNAKYKISMCRDLTLRNSCPRGVNCTFAHSEDELDKYRAKNRKVSRTPTKGSDELHKPFPASPISGPLAPGVSLSPTAPENVPPPMPTPHRINMEFASYNPAYHTHPPNASHSAVHPDVRFPVPVESSFPGRGQLVVLTPNKPPHIDYNVPPRIDTTRNQNWEQIHPNQPVQTTMVPPNFNRKPIKSMAVLQQRKTDIITQLEKVVGKSTTSAIVSRINNNENGTNGIEDKHNNANYWDSGGLQLGINTESRDVFVRSDSILTDDDYVPYEPGTPTAKFGPISRMTGTRHNRIPSSPGAAGEGKRNATPWIFSQGYHGTLPPAGGDNYINVAQPGEPPVMLRTSDNQELIVESQRVKQQLRHLERKIFDLQNAAGQNESERLAHELQLVEQEILLNRLAGANGNIQGLVQDAKVFWAQHTPVEENEDSYEADIAHDMRELELQWENELEEQERHWTNPRDKP